MSAVIRMHAFDPTCLTPEEYESLQNEVLARVIAGDVGVAERILFKMLQENAPRYHEAKRQNAADAGAQR